MIVKPPLALFVPQRPIAYNCRMDHASVSDRRRYLDVLRRMTPSQRLAKAMELSDLGKRLFLHGLRRRFPHADERQLHEIYLDRLSRCHNRNY